MSTVKLATKDDRFNIEKRVKRLFPGTAEFQGWLLKNYQMVGLPHEPLKATLLGIKLKSTFYKIKKDLIALEKQRRFKLQR